MGTKISGYRTDIPYPPLFLRQTTPAAIYLSCLFSNHLPPDIDGPMTYCELGCGQGFMANLIAATNPNIQVFATDINGEHIRSARKFAELSCITNVEFMQENFRRTAENQSLPQLDVIVIHGVYSWIQESERAAILDVCRLKLKPGGVLYISYNAFPGSTARLPLQNILSLLTGRAADAEKDLKKAFEFLEDLERLKSRCFTENLGFLNAIRQHDRRDTAYMLHEFSSGFWKPSFFSEIVSDLAVVGLEFAGPAGCSQFADDVNLDAEQLKFLRCTDDTVLRETTRDFILNTSFRRDLFIKHPRVQSVSKARDLLLEQRVVAVNVSGDPAMVPNTGSERVAFPLEQHGRLLELLEETPLSIGKLLERSSIDDRNLEAGLRAVGGLIASGHLERVVSNLQCKDRVSRAEKFNQVVLGRSEGAHRLPAVAAPVTGSGVRLNKQAQQALARLRSAGAATWPQDEEAAQEVLLDTWASTEHFRASIVPILRRLGIRTEG